MIADKKTSRKAKGTAPDHKSGRPKRSSLGQGLSALLRSDDLITTTESGVENQGAQTEKTVRLARSLPIEALSPNPQQPRRHFEKEAIETLAQSLRTRGVLQPILVRPHPSRSGAYEIIAGERRWRAAQKARLHEVPVIIRDMDESGALEVALVENIQRENLNPLEEAEGYQRLMREFGHTQQELAKLLGKSRSHIANMVRLLNLPKTVREMLTDGRLSAGHGRALLSADDPEEAAKAIVHSGLNVRETEKMTGTGKRAPSSFKTAKTPPARDPNVVALEQALSDRLGLRIAIEARGESGRVIIQFRTLEQLDNVVERLNG